MARNATDPPPDLRIAGVDLRDVAACSCQRLRKAARRATQIYEAHMRPTGLTIGQFGVLSYLYGAKKMGLPGITVGALADQLGMDPTTLKRVLGPLVAETLAVSRVDTNDRRARLLAITATGEARLAQALPLWREAQDHLHDLLGKQAGVELDRSVEAALDRMKAAT